MTSIVDQCTSWKWIKSDKLISTFESTIEFVSFWSTEKVINIGVRAGGARGAAPQILGTQIFWAAGENLGKASF